MHLSNLFVVDLIFSPVRIASYFTRLETLIFDNIKSKYLVNILHHLFSLTNLSSLIIIPIDRSQNRNDIYYNIFRLPALKYCKLSLTERFTSNPLPMSTDITSPIEHLVINHCVDLEHLNALLSYVPKLRRLSFYLHDTSHQRRRICPFSLNQLTHVSFRLDYIKFDIFEQIVMDFFSTVEVLRLTIEYSAHPAYMDANKWKQLIIYHIPNLRIFDVEFDISISNNDDQLRIETQINEFRTPFWIDRQWFFAHQFYQSRHGNRARFYSINRYSSGGTRISV
jgi:hypothetical protein